MPMTVRSHRHLLVSLKILRLWFVTLAVPSSTLTGWSMLLLMRLRTIAADVPQLAAIPTLVFAASWHSSLHVE